MHVYDVSAHRGEEVAIVRDNENRRRPGLEIERRGREKEKLGYTTAELNIPTQVYSRWAHVP